jgi:hypothetical protein
MGKQVMTKVTIEMEAKQIDEIILQEMKWHYENSMTERERLNKKLLENDIKLHEREDLEDHKKIRDATRYIIEFYSIKEEAEAYFDSFKKYEDVNEP